MNNIYLISIIVSIFLLLNYIFVIGQLIMKKKIQRQIDWGIENGKIKLEIDNKTIKNCSELYLVICSKDYPAT